MKYICLIAVITILMTSRILPQQPEPSAPLPLYSLYLEAKSAPADEQQEGRTDLRKLRGVLLSVLIPGTGQTYLGHEWKGAAITLGFMGAFLPAVLNQNNFLSREDRLTNLMNDYRNSTNYNTANRIWNDIITEESHRSDDMSRRKWFSIAAAVIYAYNIFDVVYMTEDAGVLEFSAVPPAVPSALAGVQNNLFAIKINL